MIDKRQFLDSCLHETKVIKHLATKVAGAALDYRPSPTQRSTLELMRYLTYCGILPAKALVAGNWDEAEAIEKAGEFVTPGGFAVAMDRQQAQLVRLMDLLTEEDLAARDAAMPWGTPCKLARG